MESMTTMDAGTGYEVEQNFDVLFIIYLFINLFLKK
jgi:hypothetical protein